MNPQPSAGKPHDRHPRREGDRRLAIIHANVRPVDDPYTLAERVRDVERRIGDETGHGPRPYQQRGRWFKYPPIRHPKEEGKTWLSPFSGAAVQAVRRPAPR